MWGQLNSPRYMLTPRIIRGRITHNLAFSRKRGPSFYSDNLDRLYLVENRLWFADRFTLVVTVSFRLSPTEALNQLNRK